MRVHAVINDLMNSSEKKALLDFIHTVVQEEKIVDQNEILSFGSNSQASQDVSAGFHSRNAGQCLREYRKDIEEIQRCNQIVEGELSDWSLDGDSNKEISQCFSDLESWSQSIIDEGKQSISKLKKDKLDFQTQCQNKESELEGLNSILQTSESLMDKERTYQRGKQYKRTLRNSQINKARWLLITATVAVVAYKVLSILKEMNL